MHLKSFGFSVYKFIETLLSKASKVQGMHRPSDEPVVWIKCLSAFKLMCHRDGDETVRDNVTLQEKVTVRVVFISIKMVPENEGLLWVTNNIQKCQSSHAT